MAASGVINLAVLTQLSGRDVRRRHLAGPWGGHERARHLPPDLESLGHGLAILGSGEPVASRSEVLAMGL